MDSEYVLNLGNFPARFFIALLVWLAGGWLHAVAGSAAFDRPAELEPDIAFWRQVFSQIDSDQAYMHDSRHLNVVYETVRIPPGSRARDRRRIADQVRDRYRNTLEKLASGQRKGLNAEEQRILNLWPADISNQALKEAAKRIRFQQGLADDFRAGLTRAGAWRPYIKGQLRKQNVPLGLAALPHVESSFNPEARSHVGAAGLWQFTRLTGRSFMQVDHVVDERRDPYLSSAAAAELLAYNYSVLESWPLAITAYNHGVAGMRRAVRKLGTEDIGVINRKYQGRTFGFASRNFYVAFLAAMDVEADAEKYFGTVERDAPRDDIVITMPHFVPVRSVASAAGTSLKQLRKANPALLQPIWDGTKHVPRAAVIRIPVALTGKTAESIIAAIPTSARYASQTPDQFHKVQNGEALSVIARRYNVSVSELVALNGLKSRHKIRIGQTLRLPFSGVSIPEGAVTYKVRSGDSLSVIARDAGISQSRLMELNGLKDRHRIYIGQTLYLRPPQAGSVAGEDSDA
jgi:membrane-bound lytic murein transglycosylase D